MWKSLLPLKIYEWSWKLSTISTLYRKKDDEEDEVKEEDESKDESKVEKKEEMQEQEE